MGFTTTTATPYASNAAAVSQATVSQLLRAYSPRIIAVEVADGEHRRRSSSFELVSFVGHGRLVQRLSLASCAPTLAVA